MEAKSNSFDSAKRLLEVTLQERKSRNPNYSLRAFARSLDISPAQLSQLISGKRNFTAPILKSISEKLSLSPNEERRLFESSFFSNASKLFVEKNKLQLKEDQFKLISDWYHFAILSLSKIKGATTDPKWISERLGITVKDAKTAVNRLQRLGIIRDSKALVQITQPISVTSEIPSSAIQNYHKQILELGLKKLETIHPDKRDYSAMTMAIDPKKISNVRKMIADFQDQISEELNSKNSENVYVISCQLFPLENSTRRPNE